jgi:hypothetical protein
MFDLSKEDVLTTLKNYEKIMDRVAEVVGEIGFTDVEFNAFESEKTVNWGDIYIFLCDNGSIGYQVDPLASYYGNELIDMWNCTADDFIKEILSLEAAPVIRNGIIFFESEDSVDEPPMYIPMK